MTDGMPGLVDAMAAVANERLDRSSDHWVRLDLPYDWPHRDILERMSADREGLRVGLLRSFSGTDLASSSWTTTDRPADITRWRNESLEERRTSTTILFGDARGEEEAGLRQFGATGGRGDVFSYWRGEIAVWMNEAGFPEPVQALVASLFDRLDEGEIDAPGFDLYLRVALEDTEGAFDRLRAETWRIGLLSDTRLLDAGASQEVVAENLEVRRLLDSPNETKADLGRLERLREAADEGNASAKAALAYRESQDPEHLKDVDLADLRPVLQPKRKPSKKGPTKAIDIVDFLNRAEGLEAEDAQAVFDGLNDSWDLADSDNPESPETDFTDPEGNKFRVHLQVRATKYTGLEAEADHEAGADEEAGAGDEGEANEEGDAGDDEGKWDTDRQVVAMRSSEGSSRGWLPQGGERLTGSALRKQAQVQDSQTAGDPVLPLVDAYLEARAEMTPFFPWLARHGFELLLCDSTAREAARKFVDAWLALVDGVSQRSAEDTQVIRSPVSLLEGAWGHAEGDPDDLTWAALSPLHPFWLEPALRLAEYAINNLGSPSLGDRVTWAAD